MDPIICKKCKTAPAKYGFVPDAPLYCEQCRYARAYDVLSLRCTHCNSTDDVCYGVESRRPVRCGECRQWRDLVVWPAATCTKANCNAPLTYGMTLGEPLCCASPHSKAERARCGYFVVTRAPCVGVDVLLALLYDETHQPNNDVENQLCTGRPCFAIDTQCNGEPVVCQQCAAAVRRHFTRNKLDLPKKLTHIKL